MHTHLFKIIRSLILLLLAAPAWSADIDIYAGVDNTGGRPNVLFFLDNTSNWSAANQSWTKVSVDGKCALITDTTTRNLCLSYSNTIFGASTSLTQGQVELRALRLVINELVCKTGATLPLNAGLMLFNDAGSVDSTSVVGGYIRHRIAPLDASQCAVFMNDLDNIDSKITTPEFKGPSSTDYGTALFEAFKYFGGWTNPAGAVSATAGSPTGATGFGPTRYTRPIATEDPQAFTDASKSTYKSPITTGGNCGNNYIILVGNKFPNQEYGSNTNATPPSNLNLTTRMAYNHGAQIYPIPLLNADKSDVRFADEWAKFLYNTDVSDLAGQQNIKMFTVDVYNGSQDTKQSNLLTSMAAQTGPGGYYAVNGNLYDLIKAFIDILTQVSSVNSVFASASLPVSVNAQGTFLNQVFMGLFRPDINAQQRWMGNLKQYKFAVNNNSLALVDADNNLAVDAANTGFIQQCARSFWTTGSGSYWQTITSFNTLSSCNPTTNTTPYSDSPDGPIVERGGAAQRLRSLGHAARNLKTCATTACASMVDFNAANLRGKISGMTDAQTDLLADWVRGRNTGDGYIRAADGVVTYEQYGLASTATRPTIHGEVVHSRPLAINYGSSSSNDVVVFYGAGDGALRAINANQADTDGNELWGFIAPEHWGALERVRTNSPLISYPNVLTTLTPTPTPKTYFFDGSIGGYQEFNNSVLQKVWIYPSMRRGGSGVYAFDVTAKPSGANQPILMWRYSSTDDARMGESWSTPSVFRVKGFSTPFVVFGAGHDACEDSEDPNTACSAVTRGKGIVILNAQTGPSDVANYRFIGVGTNELDSSAGRFVADITPVDLNRDGYIDVFYAVDTRGNVWRVNTSDTTTYQGIPNVANWPVLKIATVSQWDGALSERRKFMNAPAAIPLDNQVTVLIGTGDREKPSATSNAAQVVNRFYGIRDNASLTTQAQITVGIGYGSGAVSPDPAGFKDVTNSNPIDPITLSGYKGWFRSLATTAPPYEQVVTTPLALAGTVYFNTFQAKSQNNNTCSNLGTGRAYQIDFQTGVAISGYDLTTVFVTGGIPPSPVGGRVLIDGKTYPFLIGGPNPTPISPAKLKPNIAADRKPHYRYRRIDN